MVSKVKISVVSYLNSKPFVYGIENSQGLNKHNYELQMDLPATCAEKLLKGQVDLGLVPVIIIPQLKESYIISDFCIGAIGPVKTVMLYSQVPVNEINQIYLDYQSRSSVMLTKILAFELWNINPIWTPASEGYEQLIKDRTAAVVIGDRAFKMNGKFKYEYDLANEWQILTGLPFVFACWVSNKKLSAEFIADFNLALNFGLNSIDSVVKSCNSDSDQLYEYFTKYISYELDIKKKEALNLFLQKASQV